MPATRNATTITLPSDTEILITREFDAPPDVVFKAMTDPALIPQWWGPRKYETIVDTMDVRPGGAWRFINRGDGEEFAFRGEYREIAPPERIVQTFEFEPLPGHISIETAVFTEHNGRTLMTNHSQFASKEDRDAMMEGGMESGVRETYDRLAEVLAGPR